MADNCLKTDVPKFRKLHDLSITRAREAAKENTRNCPRCGEPVATGAQIYECEICGRECCTGCSNTTAEHDVICDDCHDAAEAAKEQENEMHGLQDA